MTLGELGRSRQSDSRGGAAAVAAPANVRLAKQAFRDQRQKFGVSEDRAQSSARARYPLWRLRRSNETRHHISPNPNRPTTTAMTTPYFNSKRTAP